MKCPKCGYNSFEYLDNCKKCNHELSGFKASHGIRAVVLPFRPLEQMTAPSEERMPAPQATPVADTDEEMFSWHDEPAESSPVGGEEFPIQALGQPDREPEPFSFDLDLPLATPAEEGGRELALEDLGGEGSLPLEESYSGAEQLKEEPPLQEETPFGDFSFDDLYKQEETGQEQPEEEPAPFMEPSVTDDGTVAAGPTEFSFDDLETNETPVAPEEEAVVAVEPPGAFDFDAFPFKETSLQQESCQPEEVFPAEEEAVAEEEEAFDSMGLSAEEYESLFGEAPPKKKAARN